MTATTQIITNSQAELNDELRSYAERSPVTIIRPSMEEAIAAIKPHFPELVKEHENAQQLLDAVGLSVIADISPDYKPERMSWSIVESLDEAHNELDKHSQASFRGIRKNLGIDYHWIFLVPSRNLDVSTHEDLLEGSGDFREDGEPECWILDRFR